MLIKYDDMTVMYANNVWLCMLIMYDDMTMVCMLIMNDDMTVVYGDFSLHYESFVYITMNCYH